MAVTRTQEMEVQETQMEWKEWNIPSRQSQKMYRQFHKFIRKSDSPAQCEILEHPRQFKEPSTSCITPTTESGAVFVFADVESPRHIRSSIKIPVILRASHPYISTTASWVRRPSQRRKRKSRRMLG